VKKKKWLPWVIAGIPLAGCLSAWVNIPGVEARTARWLAHDVRPCQSFYVPDAREWTLKVWDKTGARYIPYDSSTNKEHFPWRAYKPGEVLFPFLARVEYGWMQEPLVGGGGHVWYLCFFGLSFRVATTTSWAS
jgi:hypothetical protein